ncbi:MAG: exonuclease, partial [Sulfolobus sp.]|nr:exonuclease [Sulfolobus sp.]
DAIELFSPDEIYLISQNASEEFNVEELKNKKRVFFVILGIESDFNSIEKSLGKYVKIPGLNKDTSPIALLVTLFYCLLK